MNPYTRKIIVRNSSIIINDYNMGDCKSLENSFKMYDIITHTTYYLGIYYDKENRKLYVPRGIDIPKLERWLCEEAYVDHDYDNFYRFDKDTMIKSLPRNDKQKEALRFMIGNGEYEDNQYKSQLSVNLNTGEGKTYVSTATIAFESITSIIITYSKSLLRQWAEKIEEYTDLTIKNDIYLISGSDSIRRIRSGNYKKRKIYLITHSTIKSYCEQNGWDKLTKLFQELGIGMKIFDEAHQNFANTCMIDFYTNTWRTYYITATLMRSDESENIIFNYYMKNIPKIELFDEETDPHTKYLAMIYNCGANAQDISYCRNQYGLSNSKYVEVLVRKPKFWNMLDIIVDFCFKLKGKCIFYIATNEAIKIVYDYLTEHFPQLKDNVGIYTSLYTGEEKEKQKDNLFILTTTKSAGTGMDIKGLKATVVLLEPFKSPVLARQTLGRCRDKNTWYIELVDLAFSQTRRYYYSKLPIFEKYAESVEHIQFSDFSIKDKVTIIHQNILNQRYWSAYRTSIFHFVQPGERVIPLIKFDTHNTGSVPIVHFLESEESEW